MNIDVKKSSEDWLLQHSFFRDLVHRFPAVSSYFEFDPRSPGSAVIRKNQIKQQPGAPKNIISEEVVRQNTEWGAQSEGLRSARSLRDDETVVVMCQLRPRILGGPGHNLSKILSVLEYARRLKDILDVPVVPLAWVITDHNWGIMSQVDVVAHDNTVRTVKLNTALDGCPSADQISIHPGVSLMLGEFAELMRIKGEDNPVWEMLQTTAEESESLTGWFCRFISSLSELRE